MQCLAPSAVCESAPRNTHRSDLGVATVVTVYRGVQTGQGIVLVRRMGEGNDMKSSRMAAAAAIASLGMLLSACGASSIDAGSLTSSPAPADSSSAEEPAGESSSPAAEQSTEAPPPAVKSVKYSGKGNKVLKIRKPETGVVLMTTTIKGPSDNNTVYSLDDELEENDLLVNTIGSYKGTTLLDDSGEETTRLKIEVSGSWTIVLAPLNTARRVTTTAAGSKDDVLIYASDSPAILNFTSLSGDSNVTAYWITEGSSDLVVNDIGKFKTESAMTAGPGVLQISSDGKWSFKIDPA